MVGQWVPKRPPMGYKRPPRSSQEGRIGSKRPSRRPQEAQTIVSPWDVDGFPQMFQPFALPMFQDGPRGLQCRSK
eukprot:5226647-Pyramimonas_sp.AAC.1